jgi:hypothetical protein
MMTHFAKKQLITVTRPSILDNAGRTTGMSDSNVVKLVNGANDFLVVPKTFAKGRNVT